VRGKVKWFSSIKGFGFVVPDGDDKDLFVHHSNIEMEGYRTLTQGDTVEFELVKDDKGRQQAGRVRSLTRTPKARKPRVASDAK
jgi:CspA family cold shock protein